MGDISFGSLIDIIRGGDIGAFGRGGRNDYDEDYGDDTFVVVKENNNNNDDGLYDVDGNENDNNNTNANIIGVVLVIVLIIIVFALALIALRYCCNCLIDVVILSDFTILKKFKN